MSELSIVLTAAGVFIAFLGVLWGVYTAIKADVNKVDDRVTKIYEERGKLVDINNIVVQEIKKDILNRPDFDHVEENYVRKDMFLLHFESVNDKLDSMKTSIDKLTTMVRGK